ncbi:MAG: radical SAM protein [Deltaproteobacteria bacterium]|jgi:hypothetical protein|nr:radical SAM protein [Deltaproteobacteria bacterium]MBW2532828.1 radical SAM protein [Deltaproteobacteria bacterium]
MPEVTLVFPPTTKPSEPPVGIGMLGGWLRAQGIDCELIDGRLEFLEGALDRSYLDPFRNQEIYTEPDRHLGALARLNEGLRQLAPAEDRLSITDHRPTHHPLFSRDGIRQGVAESRVFAPAMAALADRIAADPPKLCGISVGYLSQLVAGLQLGRELRRRAPGLPLVYGGSLVSSWRRHLEREGLGAGERYLFGPGELCLPDVLREVGLTAAPSVAPPRYAELFDRHQYLAPKRIASVSLSRGCPWGRCTFCHEARSERFAPLRARDIERVVAGLLEQQVDCLHLTDHAVPLAALRRLAELLPGSPVEWYGFVLLSEQLADPAFVRALADSGCAMLELGIESGSVDVLDAMDKGHTPELASRIIRVLADAGIRVFGYVMFGFPSESDEDRQQTLSFLEQHAAWIHGLNVSIFNLPVGSKIEREPERFGIERLMPFREGQELSFYRDFVSGHDRRAVRHFLETKLRRSEALAPVLRRTPRSFKSNHAPFVPIRA